MVVRLSEAQVNSWRLSKHHLTQRASKGDLAKVVSDVCGIQAQVLSAAELAIRARVEGLQQQDVRNSLWKDHTILKTWCMRGTLHILASRDLPIYVAALRSKVEETQLWLEKSQGVKRSEVEAITEEIKNALANETLTREELAQRVKRRVKLRPKTANLLTSGWGILLSPAAYQGALAFGPSLGAKATFLRPDRRIPLRKRIPVGEAFVELFKRFLRSYGPATVRDFAHWWGDLSEHEISNLRNVRDDIEDVEVEGRRASMIKSDAEAANSMGPTHIVRLLPSFDCYVMFYSPREAFVPKAHRSRIFRQTAGWNYPALVIDGLAAGIWNLKRRNKRIEVELEPFRVFSSGEKKGIEEEAKDIGTFLGAPAVVKL